LAITKGSLPVYSIPTLGLICYIMKVASIFISFLLSFISVYSQKTEFGNVTVKELSNETYANDTASAIVLFDVGDLDVDQNSVSGTKFRRHMRIKILRKQAFDEWGHRRFFIHKTGDLKIKAATYNLENGIIRKAEMEESAIMRTDHDDDTRLVNIAFPNVKEGSVVEFSYMERYPDLYVPGWQFQHSIPSRWSEYTVTMPVKNLKYNLKGFLKPAVHEEKYEGSYHRWLLTDIPAFVSEPMMADKDAYISEVNFATRYYDWDGAYYYLTGSPEFGEIVHRYKFLTKTAEELTAGMVDDKQKIRAISDYIKHLVQFDGNDRIWGRNPNELIDKKKGTSGDINLLLGSMLEKAGFKVSMVLLSTRNYGFIDQKVPSLRQFNYVVCEVTTKEGDILVDATDKLLQFDMLPPRCFNQFGFLIGTGQFGWAPVQPKHRAKVLFDATVTFSDSGGLTGKLKSFKDGYAAYDVRKQFRDGGETNYKIDLGNKLWNVQNYEIKNLQAVDKPIEELCDVTIDDYVIQANDKIYFNPHLFLREESNPFVSDSRTYPVDFEKLIDNTIVCTLVLPEGYVVEEIPENKALALPGNAGKCVFSTTVSGNKIIVTSKLIFNKTFFPPAEYGALKEFYATLVAKKAENIVLKKK
jgi:hypothetical protein